jgi:hypothetical protein
VKPRSANSRTPAPPASNPEHKSLAVGDDAPTPDLRPTPETPAHAPIPPVPAPSPAILVDHSSKPQVSPPLSPGLPADPPPVHSAPPVSPLHQAAPLPVVAAQVAPLPIPTMAINLPATDLSNLAMRSTASLPAEGTHLLQQAAVDSGLSVAVLPHAAHLSLVSDSGDLSLHVRVRDGNADVNVTGSMAPMFDSKAPEVRTVLAGQGIGLGSFATDHQGSQNHPQQSNESVSPDANPYPANPRRQAASGPQVTVNDEGRIHIRA